MSDIIYPLATSTWDIEEYDALQKVITSKQFTMGRKVQEFEASFAAAVGSKYAVMLNSGSSANLVAVAACVFSSSVELNPGDEVIVPAVSWATTYFPLQQYGLRLVFVDVDFETLNLDLEALSRAISPKTKAIFAVNLLGNPLDYARVQQICDENNLILLEDNCESLGAKYKGKQTGTFGEIGTYSTFFSHHISTMEGGIAVTNNEELYQIMLSLRAHGWTRELPDKNLVHDKVGDPFIDSFNFVLPGYNLRPLEMSGAVGLAQITKIPKIVEGRRRNAEYFLASMAAFPEIMTQKDSGESSWFGFSMILTGRLSGRRGMIVEQLSKNGIQSRPIVAGNFAKNPVMKFMNASIPEPLVVADKIHEDGLFVGNHDYDITKEIDLLSNVLKKIVLKFVP